jgi:hypothetical protein
MKHPFQINLHEDAIEDAPSLTTGLDDTEPAAAPLAGKPKIEKGKPFPATKKSKAPSFAESVVTESEHEVSAAILGLKPLTRGKNQKFSFPSQVNYGGRSWTKQESGGEHWNGKTLEGIKYTDQYGNILKVTQLDEDRSEWKPVNVSGQRINKGEKVQVDTMSGWTTYEVIRINKGFIDLATDYDKKVGAFSSYAAKEFWRRMGTGSIRRVVAEMKKGVTYHVCPECDRSFPSTALIDGKLPPHTFLGKPCPGSGAAPLNESDSFKPLNKTDALYADVKESADDEIRVGKVVATYDSMYLAKQAVNRINSNVKGYTVKAAEDQRSVSWSRWTASSSRTRK